MLLFVQFLILILPISFANHATVRELLAPETSSVSLSCSPLLQEENCTRASWFREGQIIGTSTSNSNLVLRFDMKIPVPDDQPQIGLLQLVGLRKGDGGRFWCLCNGTVGQVARVRIVYLDESFKNAAQLLQTTAGHSVILKCRKPAGFPTPSVRWERNGDLILPDDRFSVTSLGDLMITSASISDTGHYKCIAWNVAGERNLVHLLTVLPASWHPKLHSPSSAKQNFANNHSMLQAIFSTLCYLLGCVLIILLLVDILWHAAPSLAGYSRCCFSWLNRTLLAGCHSRWPRPPTYEVCNDEFTFHLPPPPYSVVTGRLLRIRPASVV
ncbi:Netrin receptor UNC5A [Trichinella zimbabwensis]|uniref:Netrin receptor UNC5A n=1 Tax=Trichinella zimbabwensis TaxID=268475 RepID=A0A0V1I3M0_9BILA|nr:Netrin receptor UNC5A [Trichinella zimbabwensis]